MDRFDLVAVINQLPYCVILCQDSPYIYTITHQSTIKGTVAHPCPTCSRPLPEETSWAFCLLNVKCYMSNAALLLFSADVCQCLLNVGCLSLRIHAPPAAGTSQGRKKRAGLSKIIRTWLLRIGCLALRIRAPPAAGPSQGRKHANTKKNRTHAAQLYFVVITSPARVREMRLAGLSNVKSTCLLRNGCLAFPIHAPPAAGPSQRAFHNSCAIPRGLLKFQLEHNFRCVCVCACVCVANLIRACRRPLPEKKTSCISYVNVS